MKLKEKIKDFWGLFNDDPGQKRTFSHVVLFFFVMLLLTLIARGTVGSRLATVRTVSPNVQELSETIHLSGTAAPIGNYPATVPAELPIDKVMKAVGNTVQEGDLLAMVDEAAFHDLLTRKQAALRQMEIQLESLVKMACSSSRELSAAQKQLQKAQDTLEKAQSALEKGDEEEKTAAQTELEAAEAALAQAQTEFDTILLYVQPSASVLALDIAAARKALGPLEQIRAAEGRITAHHSGELTAFQLAAGTVTDGTEEIVISTEHKGFALTFYASQEDYERLFHYKPALTAAQGDREETFKTYNPVMETLQSDWVTCTAKLNTTGWKDGGISLSGTLWEKTYNTCIPRSALRQDSSGYFVYVLDTVYTLMGIEQRVTRVDVFIEEMDGIYAAVQGDLSSNSQIVYASDRPLSSGDSVRVGP